MSLAQFFGRIDHPLPRLLQLLARLVHLRLLGRLSHLVADFIGVVQQLLLIVAQALQLPFELLAFGVGLGGAEGRVQFLQLLVDPLLTPSQLLQTIQDRQFLALRRVRLLLSRALQFVPVLLVVELQLRHLLFRHTGTLSPATAALLALHHQMFFGTQLEQPLIGTLLGGRRRVQRSQTGLGKRRPQRLIGLGHPFANHAEDRLQLGNGDFLFQRFELLDRLLLAVLNDFDAVAGGRVELGPRRPHELPCRDDDLLLQFEQLVGRVPLLLAAR